jgi:hypothetical protein
MWQLALVQAISLQETCQEMNYYLHIPCDIACHPLAINTHHLLGGLENSQWGEVDTVLHQRTL